MTASIGMVGAPNGTEGTPRSYHIWRHVPSPFARRLLRVRFPGGEEGS